MKYLSFFFVAFVLVVTLVTLFNLPGTQTARELSVGKYEIGFNVYNWRDQYWGDFAINSSDHTLMHSNNLHGKFRTDIGELDYIQYREIDDDRGDLFVKFAKGQNETFIASIPIEYWEAIISYVDGWPEMEKFVTVAD